MLELIKKKRGNVQEQQELDYDGDEEMGEDEMEEGEIEESEDEFVSEEEEADSENEKIPKVVPAY